MIEQISTTSTMQANKTIQSVSDTAGNVKAKEVSEKEMTAVQADVSRKCDRFEYSSEASNAAGSANAPKAGEASDEKQSAAKANDNPRSRDRVEFTYASAASEDVKASDVSAEKMSDSKDDSSSQSVSADNSSESVDTNKLYQYTATELKEFLIDGSITQSEYDAEIAKREY